MFYLQFFKFIKYFGNGYQVKLFKMLIMAFLSSFLEFASIALVFPFILMLVNPNAIIYGPIGTTISRYITLPNNQTLLFVIGSTFITLIIIKNIFSIFILYWQNKVIKQWCLEVKEKMMSFFLYAPFELDLKQAQTDTIFKISKNVDLVFEYFVFKVIVFTSNSLVVAIIFSILAYLLPFYTILAMVFFITASLLQNRFFRNWSSKIAEQKAVLLTSEYNSIIDSLRHIKDIKINGCQPFFFDIYKKISAKIIPLDEKLNLIPIIPQYIIELIFIFTMVIFCFGIFYQYGTNTADVVVSLSIVAISIFRMVPQIYKSQVCLNYIGFYKEHVQELFNIYEEYYQYLGKMQTPTDEKMSFKNSITVDNLYYSYTKTATTLENISFEIKKGEFVGIIGLSGAGKSTLVDCLLGLLEYKGNIYIDGVRLTHDNLRSFQNIIGYVSQEITTVGGNVASNVAFGIEENKIDRNKVIDSLQSAQIYDSLVKERQGIDTVIQQDGTGLSQGQKQRVGIARALYRNPEIIILDEATSNLDVKIENELTQIMNEFKGKKTIIAIAHRISTLVNCDKIIYLKNGSIVDMGTFEELSQKYPDFKEIIKLSRINLEN